MGMRFIGKDKAALEDFFRLDDKGQQWLSESWHELVAGFGASTETCQKSLDALLRHYHKRGRHYHNSSHLWALLQWHERYQNQLHNSAAVACAIWFHDVIYVSRRHDNEPRSADYATTTLALLGASSELIDDIAQLIVATKTHQLDDLPARLRHDGSWFLDFDLAILGSRPEVYRAYALAIRREYAWVPTFIFRKRRRALLEIFLQRPHLYFTETMRATLETQARKNLTNEIAELT